MSETACRQQQDGVALIVALLFLGVVTIISVVAAKNSAVSLQVSGNMRDASDSFQAAEAGAFAALGLASNGGPNDPFMREDELTPFSELDINTEHPLRNLNDGANSVDVDVVLTAAGTSCPRSENASSSVVMECKYYHISSEHSVANKARTEVHLGVIKEQTPSLSRPN